MENTRNLAILMDFENLAIGIENSDAEGRRIVEVRDLIEFFAQHYGKILVKKAYADWANPTIKKYIHELARCGVEMKQIARMGNNKNNAESYLIIDAIELLHEKPFIDTIVLVTGDAAFLPLISHIRATGRTVIGIGPQGTIANVLVHNSDGYLAIGQDEIYDIHMERTDRSRFIRVLRNIIGTDAIPLATLQKRFEETNPEFNAEDFGVETLEDFLEDLPNQFHLDYSSSDSPIVTCCYTPRPSHGNYSSIYSKAFSKSNMEDTISSRPLEEYLKDTRMFINDGPTREDVLMNIFNFLASPEVQENPPTLDDVHDKVTLGLSVTDQDWRGTVYSLSSGSCIHDFDSNSPLPKNRHHIALNRNISTLEDFVLKYYTSLFHKAFGERDDITVDNMLNLMHPEAAKQYEELFQKVLYELQNSQK